MTTPLPAPAREPAPRWPGTTARRIPATFKQQPEDFVVREKLPFAASGAGEHLYLEIEKRGLGTPELARMLADAHGIEHVDVGFAGMKDKQAVTRQWFSLRGVDAFDEVLEAWPELQVLQTTRHQHKLRRGMLAGNSFQILLRDVPPSEDPTPVLVRLSAEGAPNYFGAQRFGWDNFSLASAWLKDRRRRRVSRFKEGLYRSVVRSYLFNEVLAARVRESSWQSTLEGDVLDERGLPTAPLWGRGRTATTEGALSIERAALAPYAELLEGLEHAGLKQDRRSLVLRAGNLSWCRDTDGNLAVSFFLPAGQYATSFLGDAFALTEGGESASELMEVLP
ncbi:MAG: tRNA pseudouridine(13) synthase TruD [Pseudomonadota bacterium]